MVGSLEMAVLALDATAVFVLNFRRRLMHFDNMKVRAEKMERAIANQSLYIRSLARVTLHAKRLYKSKVLVRDRLQLRLEEVRDLVRKACSVDCRLHILDDRRTASDSNWVASLRHPEFRSMVLSDVNVETERQWRIGRRLLVWAVDKERATDKIEQYYPCKSGYIVSSIDCAPNVII